VLYVAATRAVDLLILSGATDRALAMPDGPIRNGASWLHWLVAILGDDGAIDANQRIVELGDARVRMIGPRIAIVAPERADPPRAERAEPGSERDAFRVVETVRRRLEPIVPAEGRSARRYAATALQSYVNCQRQFYYGRLLRLPGSGTAVSRDAAERPDHESRMPASLRGLVIHRFCETYVEGDELDARLGRAFDDVRATRGDAYADVFATLDRDAACRSLRRLARNYVASGMRMRVEERLAAGTRLPDGQHEFVRSEVAFTLRVPEAYVHGTIDKLLLTPLPSGRVRVSIVDFKTAPLPPANGDGDAGAIERAAAEHGFQMQVYALAVRALVPNVASVEAALHFLDAGPDVEYYLPAEVIAEPRATKEVGRVLTEIARGGFDPVMFEARPGRRCRGCAFSAICPEGALHLAG
jgi:ATP-dependent exoDNAse (exonuclease V) beta subunit